MAKPHQGRISEICKAFEALAKLFFSFPPFYRGLVFETFASMHPNRFSSRSPLYRKVSKALARQPKALKATQGLARPLRDLPEAFSRPISLRFRGLSRPLRGLPFACFPLQWKHSEAYPRPLRVSEAHFLGFEATRGLPRPLRGLPFCVFPLTVEAFRGLRGLESI